MLPPLLSRWLEVFAKLRGGFRIERHEFDDQAVRSALGAADVDGLAAGLVKRIAIDAGSFKESVRLQL